MINETFVSTQNTAVIDTLNSLQPIVPFVLIVAAVCIILIVLPPIIVEWVVRRNFKKVRK